MSNNNTPVDLAVERVSAAMEVYIEDLLAQIGWHKDSDGKWNFPELHLHGRERPEGTVEAINELYNQIKLQKSQLVNILEQLEKGYNVDACWSLRELLGKNK